MLQKTKSKQISKIKYVIILPLILSMLVYVSCSDEASFKEEEINEIPLSEVEIEVINEQITEEEFNIRVEALKEHYAKKGKDITGKDLQELLDKIELLKSKTIFEVNPNIEEVEVPIVEDVPFSVIDKAPTFPNCSGTNEQLKECMSASVSAHINNEFNVDLGKELGLTGINRIFVLFKINKQGNIVDIRSRAPHPALEAEAVRVIKTLPQMQPGEQEGVPVGVLYSLPISFKIED